MNERKIVGYLATIILLALPVAEFARDGHPSETAIGALLILAFGGGGFAADKALKARIRRWTEDGSTDEKDGTDA